MGNYDDFIMEIKEICHIDLSYYKEKQMRRRIESLIRRNGLGDYKSYTDLLKKSKQHLKEFLGYITINVSEFFRNPNQWTVLEQEILPELLTHKKRLKVWSSACSTGEEPYSLAMLFKKMGYLNNIQIIASDIDKDAVKQAQLGIYSEKSVDNVPKDMLREHFIKEDNFYIINEEIKNKIDYKIINLLNDDFPRACDLILCRNVMIYFTEEAKDMLYKKFYDALSPNGIFFVGSTEQIIMPQKYGFTSRKNFFYEKTIK